jgi:uncharacterized protein YegL
MASIDYSGNPNQRTPCVLVLDASSSMAAATPSGRTRIEALNLGIKALEDALRDDDMALGRVQISIVSVGGPTDDAEIMLDWTDANNFSAFPLQTGGSTPLAKGLQLALDLIEEGKENLKAAGVNYHRPWMMVITDGEPTDTDSEWNEAVKACRDAENAKKVEIFPIGVEGADISKLSEISSKSPIKLSGIKFKELFVWLSNSLGAVSRSRPGESIEIPTTDPWRDVSS